MKQHPLFESFTTAEQNKLAALSPIAVSYALEASDLLDKHTFIWAYEVAKGYAKRNNLPSPQLPAPPKKIYSSKGRTMGRGNVVTPITHIAQQRALSQRKNGEFLVRKSPETGFTVEQLQQKYLQEYLPGLQNLIHSQKKAEWSIND